MQALGFVHASYPSLSPHLDILICSTTLAATDKQTIFTYLRQKTSREDAASEKFLWKMFCPTSLHPTINLCILIG